MSRWRGEHAALHVGARELVLDAGGAATTLACRPGDWAALAGELPARPGLAVTLADCWVRYFLLAPPEGVASLRDCRLLLDARFEALYGQSPHEWVLQADWQAGAPMLACAVPRALVQALSPARPASIRPALLNLWNRHCARLPQTGALCAHADGMANLLYWSGSTVRLVRQQRGADPDALLALELARLEADVPAARFWSGAHAPAGWTALEAAA